MAFEEVSNKVDFIQLEHQVIQFWKDTNALGRLRILNKDKPTWSFLDGPITANNPMGVHHGWGRTYKDLYNRFWAMSGHEMRYQQGFDCQGLWVEVEVEKELGFKSKKDIETYGLDKFVLKCKERVLRYAAVQTEQSMRLGYWMDWNDPYVLRKLAGALVENPQQQTSMPGVNGEVTGTAEQLVGQLGQLHVGGSYFTFADENNYMIWHFLKKCWEKDWLYRGADVMPWCPRCATGISQHEIVTDGYAELTHRSVTLRFPLRSRPGEALLVWTTTPWTLSSNVAAAVGPELTYAKVRQGDEFLYLSKGTLHMLRGPYEVVAELKGSEMLGWTYDGPFDDLEAAGQKGGVTELEELLKGVEDSARTAHRVIAWDQVGEAEGTGIVHIAPGCGAEDFQLGKEYKLPLLAPIDDEGVFVEKFGWLTGLQVANVAAPIFDDLERKGVLYHVEPYTHRYPTCWRCKTELVFRLVDEWFINVGEVYDKPREALTPEEKAASLRYQIMDVVDQIRWIPEFGQARELDWLRNMHDWMISKKRYWGLALPIWVCGECKHFHVVGSDHELKERAVEGWETFEGHTPHRPYVDAVKIACTKCGSTMERIPDVGNPWLDAGIVSFSTTGYRSDRAYFEKWFPADWVSESFPGQFRNWFYSLLAMGTVVAEAPPFKTLFGYASLLAEDGREMHKSWGNSIEFNEAADKMGVDVMRWLYCAHKPENNLLFGYHRADDVRRRFLIPVWNMYGFLVNYARLDGWLPPQEDFDPAQPEGPTPTSSNPLDRWVLARINQVTARVTDALQNYDAFAATLVLETFIDDLSNWYIRRSRRRYWKGEHDEDKNAAYATLYHVFVRLVRLLAPITPFFTEAMYQNLVVNVQPNAHASVHHTTYPLVDQNALDDGLVAQMDLARRVASLGLSARGAANLKVRQPLSKVYVYVSEGRAELSKSLEDIVADELNVKAFEFVTQAEKLVSYRIMPNNKLLGPRLGAAFPKLREALAAVAPGKVAAAVAAGESLPLVVDGSEMLLAPEEIVVETRPAEGLAVAADKVVTVGLDAQVTPELKMEGLAREVVRRIQAMRKSADFNIEDRIVTHYSGDDELVAVLEQWASYIKAETLSVSLVAGDGPAGAYVEEQKIDSAVLRLAVMRSA